jgi:LysM repeat protein
MDPRTRRSPARFLAPLALIAVVIAFLMIVNSSNTGGSNSATETGGTATQTSSKSKTTSKTSTAKAKAKARGSRFYVVQVGDTLGGIASKTGVPLARIQELNPNVDPHAMTSGQKIRLR